MLTTAGRATIIVSSIFPILSTVAVALRLHARRLKRLPFRIDDYAALLALIITLVMNALTIVGATIGGIGVHIQDITPSQLLLFLKILFALKFGYLANVALVRFSILIFYTQLFPSRRFKLAVHAMCYIVLLWFIAFFFATLFQAMPIDINWTNGPGISINKYAMYTATAATETLLNIATLVFPWPIVWMLKIDGKYKRIVSGIFLLGGIVCISSIVRLYYFAILLNPSADQLADFTYNLTNLSIWSAIEPCLGVICACLPVLGPIFQCHYPRTVVNGPRRNIVLDTSSKNRVNSPNLAMKPSTSAGSNDSMATPFYKMNVGGEAMMLEVPV